MTKQVLRDFILSSFIETFKKEKYYLNDDNEIQKELMEILKVLADDLSARLEIKLCY